MFHHFPSRHLGQDVGAIDALCIVAIEGSGERTNGFEFGLQRQEIFGAKHIGIDCALKSIFGIDVPGSKFKVVECGKGEDFLIRKTAFCLARADTNFVVLCKCAHRFGESFACREHTCNKCGANGAEPNNHHTKFSCSFCHILERF